MNDNAQWISQPFKKTIYIPASRSTDPKVKHLAHETALYLDFTQVIICLRSRFFNFCIKITLKVHNILIHDLQSSYFCFQIFCIVIYQSLAFTHSHLHLKIKNKYLQYHDNFFNMWSCYTLWPKYYFCREDISSMIWNPINRCSISIAVKLQCSGKLDPEIDSFCLVSGSFLSAIGI